jgi:hypothetical protein
VGDRKLQDRTLDQLTESFVELVLSSAKASLSESDVLRAGIQDIEEELKARGSEHHTDLLPLAAHSEEAVRFEAVAATFRMMLGSSEVDARLVQRVAVATGAPFLQKTSSTRRVVRMSRDKLSKLTTEELVDRFVAIGLAQDEANLYNEIGKYNRLYSQMKLVEDELQSREGDQRHALLPLYGHANALVRLKAAFATLAMAPDASRAVLQDISDSNRYPEAADARGMMRALDEGTFKPFSPQRRGLT